METVAWSAILEFEGCGTPKEKCYLTSRLWTLMPLLTYIALSGLFWSPPLRKRKRSTSRRVLSGGRTSHLSFALPMVPSTAKASTFSGAFRHGWLWSGRCHTVELWALSTCDCRWLSCVLQFTVYVGPGGSFSPSPTTQEQPSPYFPRLSSFCSHFLLVVLASLLSMPGLQTFWSSLLIIRSQSSTRPAFSD